MQLVLNLSMLGQNPTGLGVYAGHCADALARRFNVQLIAGSGANPPGEVVAQAPAHTSIGGGRLAAIRRQVWMRKLALDPSSLVYSPTHHGLPNQAGQIITVHDLICLRFPRQHKPQYLFFRFGLPRLLKSCRAVFTVSETTREDITRVYGYPLERIHVIPNGVDRQVFARSGTGGSGKMAPYLLMVGARYEHKNVQEVLARSAYWRGRFVLRVTSCGGRYRQAMTRLVDDLRLHDDVIFEDYLSRDALISRYQNASALVYPSKWEGFGIPPLEALACGTPVIASDIPVHREVLGDAAAYVTLGDPVSWAAAFERIQSLADVDAMLVSGNERLARFTWGASANRLERTLLKVAPELEKFQPNSIDAEIIKES